MIRVGVAGAAGRMGVTVCAAIAAADDLELSGRADPQLGVSLAEILGDCEVVVDFTEPNVALDNALACLGAGVHVVVGTTGFDVAALEGVGGANAFVAPNFAIGAVLMMTFAAQAARHMAAAEIIELHRAGKLDAPSGTAARTADPLRSPPRPRRPPGGDPRRCRADADHSPRFARAGVVHAGCAARGAARRLARALAGGRARAPAVRGLSAIRRAIAPQVGLAARLRY